SPMTPEEKLLRAIFGEKASDVRDTSLKLPPGVAGTVVEVRVFSRRGVDKDERALAIERAEIERHAKDRDDEIAILERSFQREIRARLLKRKLLGGSKDLKPGTLITEEILDNLTLGQQLQITIGNDKVMGEIESRKTRHEDDVAEYQRRFDDKVEKLERGDELPPGVMKLVKVFVAVKRKLQPGDKMAGRHGNKGVISRITPIEDMPTLEDGTPIDLVLNPLGVPSRMNVGQILETHLGWACAGLGQQIGDVLDKINHGEAVIEDLHEKLKDVYGEPTYKSDIADLDEGEVVELAGNLRNGIPIATPVFDGAHEDDIVELLKKANVDVSGQVKLFDG
ncbi:MAG TPA: DNA-directed RNA polymerase subunit beta, partial [Rhodospirillales bacterium]|nr:DNA-directed RNA polymerase subunit beta [Rhodospirillales bacterium]